MHSNATRRASHVPKERSSENRHYSLDFAASTLPLMFVHAGAHEAAVPGIKVTVGWETGVFLPRKGQDNEVPPNE